MSPDHPAVRVRGLGKKYTLSGRQEGYQTLRDAMANFLKAPFSMYPRALLNEGFSAMKYDMITRSIMKPSD